MLDASGNKTVLLIALHDGGAELTDKIRILAEGFIHSAPSGISANTKNGREHPVKSVCVDFLCGHFTCFFNEVRVP